MTLDEGDYDVLLMRYGVDATDLPIQRLNLSDRHYTNDPLQSQFARQLIAELRQHLRQTLSDYMIPSAFVPLETLPLTSNGNVDRHAFPGLSEDLIYSSSTPNAQSLNQNTAHLQKQFKDCLLANNSSIPASVASSSLQDNCY